MGWFALDDPPYTSLSKDGHLGVSRHTTCGYRERCDETRNSYSPWHFRPAGASTDFNDECRCSGWFKSEPGRVFAVTVADAECYYEAFLCFSAGATYGYAVPKSYSLGR